MATKPTIYKCRIDLSDLNRNHYETLNLTVALHPSETLERMMARIIAYCINVREHLIFSKGISDPDEPALWQHSLHGSLELWIDVGEPQVDRIKKASGLAREVLVYSFNSKADTWWQQEKDRFNKLKAIFYRFDWLQIQALTQLVERTMEMSITLTGDSAYVTTDKGDCELSWVELS